MNELSIVDACELLRLMTVRADAEAQRIAEKEEHRVKAEESRDSQAVERTRKALEEAQRKSQAEIDEILRRSRCEP